MASRWTNVHLDANVCRTCRNFEPTKVSETGHYVLIDLTLAGLRHTAGGGCLRCQLLLDGLNYFSWFWEGSTENSATEGTPWTEDEIGIGLTPYFDAVMEMRVTRPIRGSEGLGDFVDLEFFSHVGKSARFTVITRPTK